MKNINFQNLKKIAFTLAETLIVIGIIGVVSALTIPNLNKATGEKEKIARVKKVYATLVNAYEKAKVSYGDLESWRKGIPEDDNIGRSTLFAKRIIEYMKISKVCSNSDGCFSAAPILYLDTSLGSGSSFLSYLQSEAYYMVTMSDGVSLAFKFNSDSGAQIVADIDGPNKGKNQYGVDIFVYELYSDYLPLNCYGTEENNDIKVAIPKCFSSGMGCSCWIIGYDNMDYLKADNVGKCKDSDIVLDGVANITCH